MTLALDDFETVKRQIGILRRDRDKALGTYEGLLKRLESEFNCKSLQEAEELLDGMIKKERNLQSLWSKQLSLFKKKWGHKLKEIKDAD